jgi:hypothetical protein
MSRPPHGFFSEDAMSRIFQPFKSESDRLRERQRADSKEQLAIVRQDLFRLLAGVHLMVDHDKSTREERADYADKLTNSLASMVEVLDKTAGAL